MLFIKFACSLLSLHVIYKVCVCSVKFPAGSLLNLHAYYIKYACYFALLSIHAVYTVCMCSVEFSCSLLR